jgi:hypothetical protein
MKEIKLKGRVDVNHKLQVEVPSEVAPGELELILLLPQDEEEATEKEWEMGVSREWAAEWSDPHEGIYTVTDGISNPSDIR